MEGGWGSGLRLRQITLKTKKREKKNRSSGATLAANDSAKGEQDVKAKAAGSHVTPRAAIG